MLRYLLIIQLITFSASLSFAQQNCSSTCSGTLGENIFPNGDFGTGLPNILPVNPNLAPGYIYQTNPPPNDGYYCITNNTTNWGWFANTFWINIEDNGPEDNGYMMVVNASYQPGLFYEKTVDVCDNTLYELSLDVINLFRNQFQGFILPNISFLIDGVVVCETGNIQQDETWHRMRFSFVSGSSQGAVTLSLRNNAPGGGGNDLAIDNISFRACGPSITVPQNVQFCLGTPVTIHSVLENTPYNNTVYQWQIFNNGLWEDIPNANNASLDLANPIDGSLVRLLVASQVSNLLLPNCRVVSTPVLLEQIPGLIVNTSVQDISCSTAATAIAVVDTSTGTAPFSYTWSSGQSNAVITNLSTGTFQVTVTDTNGCTGLGAVTVSAPPALSTSAMATEATCFGNADGTAIASVTGGVAPFSYLWSNGDTTANLSNLPAGTYQITVTDANACSGLALVTINEPPALTANATATDVSCFGGATATAVASVSGGVSPYSYAWSSGQITATISNLSAGAYLVTVTDAKVCTQLVSVTINEPPILETNTSATAVSCFGANDAAASISVAGGVSPYTYAWSSGQTTATTTNLAAGAYLITVTDANACTGLSSATVTEPPVLTANATTVDIPCFGSSSGSVETIVSGGVSPYTYEWSNGQSSVNISNLGAGIYQVTVTDANNCTEFISAAVTEPPILTANASTMESSCFGDNNGSVAASVSGGVPPYSYQWSTGQNTGNISNLMAGTYQVTVTDANACTEFVSVTVTEPPILTANAISLNVSCFGGNNASASALASGGVSPYSYQWSNGQSTANISSLTAGTYQVTIADANACTELVAVTATEPSALIANISQADVSCFGAQDGTILVTVDGGETPYSYEWGNGLTSANIANLTVGNYSVTVTDANGCLWNSSAQVYEPPLLSVGAEGTQISCHGMTDGALVAFASGGIAPYEFSWSNGQTTPEISGLGPGTYTVNVMDAIGCSVATSEYLIDQTALAVNLGTDLVVNLGDIIDLEAVVNLAQSAILDYTWSGSTDSLHCADCFTYSFQPIEAGCQRVLVRSKRGCIAIDTVCYEVRRPRNVYAPNIFSPNDDGDNDFFTIFSDDSVAEILSLSIYNRWGGHLFLAQHIQTNDERAGWDGTFKGLPMNPDVFVWMAELLFIDGTKLLLSGDVTLLR